MDDEVAWTSLTSHLSHCEACKFVVWNHGFDGEMRKTLELATKQIDDWEKKEGKVFVG